DVMLADTDRAGIVQADMRDPDSVFDSPQARRLLDFDEPVGVLMLLMLHWLPDESDPLGLLARYREPLAGGSCLAITHVMRDDQDDRLAEATGGIQRSRSVDPMTPRSPAEVVPMFGDFELLEP